MHPIFFLFSNIETNDLIDTFSIVIQNDQPKPGKKTKCNHCSRKVKQNVSVVYCRICSQFYHLKCSNINKDNFPLPDTWHCNSCSINDLPFSNISNDNLILNLQGLSDNSINQLTNLPSFTIQSLLDQLPGQNFSTDDFLSDSIESKYYTPAQFINEKFSKKLFPWYI